MGISTENLLEWMGTYHLPLELFREDETQLWVVVDVSCGCVIGSGESPTIALFEAHKKHSQ